MNRHQIFLAEIHQRNFTVSQFSDNTVRLISYNGKLKIECVLVGQTWITTAYKDGRPMESFSSNFLTTGIVEALHSLRLEKG